MTKTRISNFCKRTFALVGMTCLSIVHGLSQAPALIPYQGVIRDNSGQAIINSSVTTRFSIHNNAVDGPVVWQESHTTTTTNTGIINLQLGSIESLTPINWSEGFKFLEIELLNGNTFISLGTQQMMSVPYALHAETANTTFADNGISRISFFGDTLYLGNGSPIIIPGISYINGRCDPHTCGAINVHNPNIAYNTVMDHEGNSYKTTIIGNQEWMAENLAVSTYRNGDPIPTGLNNSSWSTTTAGAWAYLFDDPTYNCPFGKLYNWYTVLDERGVCPIGWHVPSIAEWNVLSDFLGDSIGHKMTSALGTYWDIPCNGAGTNRASNNLSGFSALPNGLRINDGSYSQGYCLSATFQSTTNSSINGNSLLIYYESPLPSFDIFDFSKNNGYAIRCLKD